MSIDRLPLESLGAARRSLRTWFEAQGFVEVDTPVLLRAPAPERFIDPPPVSLSAGMGAPAQRRFLQASPELAMKRLLAEGLPRIFQVAPCFRDGDHGPHHRPEFRLLEWYRVHEDWRAAMDDCEALLRAVARALAAGPAGTSPLAAFVGPLLAGEAIPRVSFDEAFLRHAHIDLAACETAPLLAAALAREGIHHEADDAYDELCHRVLVGRVEPALTAAGGPVFLTHFPLAMASWAAPSRTSANRAERFELYAGGFELANGFTELTDAAALAERFAIEQNERHRRRKIPFAHADAFFDCLARLPPCVGTAMGIERMLMAISGRHEIEAVQWIPFSSA